MVAVIIDTNCPASNTEIVGVGCLMELRDDHQRDYKDDFALQDFLDRLLANNAPLWVQTRMPMPGDKRQLIE